MYNFIFYSASDLETLSSILLTQLKKDFKDKTIFQSPTIIVPNRALSKWLETFIADRIGLFTNIKFSDFEKKIIELVKEIKKDKNKYILLGSNKNKDEYVDIIFYILKKNIKEEKLNIIRKYVEKGGNENNNARLYIIAKKLAMFFIDYEFYKKDMIEEWKKNREYVFKKDNSLFIKSIEEMERFIYQKILEIKNNNDNIITLTDYISCIGSEDKCLSKEILYFLGFSDISKEHYNILFRMGYFYEIKFFHIDLFPVEYKENGITITYKNRLIEKLANANIKNTTQFFNSAIEKFKMENKNFKFLLKRTNPKKLKEETLLNCLKNSINGYEIEKGKQDQDMSLQIFKAPTIYREIETVYNSIIYNLNSNKKLKQTDIAIFVSDMKEYSTAIKNVFDRDWIGNKNFLLSPKEKRTKKVLVYNNLTLSGNETLFGNAILTILNINKDSTCDDIIKLFQNRFFLKCNDLDLKEAKALTTTLKELSAIEGFDLNSTAAPYSITYAIDRIILSKILSNISYKDIKDYTKIIPYNSIFDREWMEKCIPLLYEILEWINKINYNEESLSLKDWCSILIDFINKFFSIKRKKIKEKDFEIKQGDSVKARVIAELNSIKNKCDLPSKEFTLDFKIDEIIEFLKELLSTINVVDNYSTTNIGRVNGITISTLNNFRSIPKKIVYLVGLNDNLFPKKNIDSILNIRTLDRDDNDNNDDNDVTNIEESKNLFMELVLSTKDKLYLSYCGEDIIKEKKLYLSSIVNTLKNYIEDTFKIKNNFNENKFNESKNDENKYEFIEIDIPLKSYNKIYFDNNKDREKLSKITDIFNNYSYIDYMIYKRVENREKKVERSISSLNIETAFKITNKEKELNITLSDLKKLIRYPFETKLNILFNIFEEKDNKKINFKPIYIDELMKWELIVPFLEEYLEKYIDYENGDKRGDKNDDENINDNFNNCELTKFIKDNFDKYFQYNTLLAKIPTTTIFKEFTKMELYTQLENYEKVIKETMKSLKKRYTNFYNSFEFIDFNSSDYDNQNKTFYIKPIEKYIKRDGREDEILTVKISGRGKLFLFEGIDEDTESDNYHILVISTAAPNEHITHHILEPFFFFLTALCSNEKFPEKIITTIIYKDGNVKNMEFSATSSEAEKFLSNLIYYMFDENNFCDVDFAALNVSYNSELKDFNFVKYLDYLDKKEDTKLSVKNIINMSQPTEKELEKIIDNKFKFIFNGIKENLL